ncbi:MAG: hypothetical protein Q9220_007453, partial [cf. Caloplaca sp. 1 TL-2023]
LLDSVAAIYTLLSNSSNVTLLTAQILSAPALWSLSMNLHLVVRVIDLFKSASLDVSRRQKASTLSPFSEFQSKLDLDEWTSAVLKAFDEACPPPRRLLLLAGLLQGHADQLRAGVPTRTFNTLQAAFVNAVNLSIRADRIQTDVTGQGLAIAVGQAFDLLDVRSRASLDHDLLLPMLTWAMFSARDGLHEGYFLGAIDADVVEGNESKFDWSTESHSYLQLHSLASAAAVQILETFRNLYFVSSRLNIDVTSQYLLVYFAAVDTISYSPVHAEHFMTEIQPAAIGKMPYHPLDRLLDLFYLNTAEHLVGVLSTDTASHLLIMAAFPYLGINADSLSKDAVPEAVSSSSAAAGPDGFPTITLVSTASVLVIRHSRNTTYTSRGCFFSTISQLLEQQQHLRKSRTQV